LAMQPEFGVLFKCSDGAGNAENQQEEPAQRPRYKWTLRRIFKRRFR
jgi:hypothetical protein